MLKQMERLYNTSCNSADQVIKTVWKKFEEHPAAHNQTYLEHLKTSIEQGTTS